MGYFIQYGEELRLANRVLILLVVILSLLIVMLAFTAASKKVIYINPASVVGTGAPGTVTESYIEYFARYFVYLMGNFSSQTIKDMYQQALYLMKPSLAKSVVDMLNSEIREAERAQIAIETFTEEVEIKKTEGGLYAVDVKCIRDYYAGERLVTRKRIGYRLLIGKTDFRNEKNPFGLWVVDYEGPTDLGTVEVER